MASRHACPLAIALVLAACSSESLVGIEYGPATRRGEPKLSGGPCDGDGLCDDCRSCARELRCAAQDQQCEESPPCQALASCVRGCEDDPSCEDNCEAENPDGVALHAAVQTCVRCECMTDCGETYSCTGL